MKKFFKYMLIELAIGAIMFGAAIYLVKKQIGPYLDL